MEVVRSASSDIAPSTDLFVKVLCLWHLLSLDGPTVAALWTWFVARSLHVALPTIAPLAMFLTVWIIYAADRLLDSRHPTGLKTRHRFHRRHWRPFMVVIALALSALALLLSRIEIQFSLYRSVLVLALMLLGWLVAVHSGVRNLPKELVVGLFFGAAVFTLPFAQHFSAALFVPACAFTLLCILNCLFIASWELEADSPDLAEGASPRAWQHHELLALLTTVGAFLLAFFEPARSAPILFACSLACASLVGLHLNRRWLGSTTLRAAADLVLLTPLLMLRLLR